MENITMNLSLLDREHLESILLDPSPADVAFDFDFAMPSGLLGSASPNARGRRVQHVLAAAHELLTRIAAQAIVGRTLVSSPSLIKDFLKITFAGAERETFVVIFLDVQLRVIASEVLFAGTLTQTSVYPREVVRRALHHNAAGLICAHPHPSSGSAEPSRADELLTGTLKAALGTVDIRLVDHVIVSGLHCVSLAERGLL
jgi:DNA repair protein RadC